MTDPERAEAEASDMESVEEDDEKVVGSEITKKEFLARLQNHFSAVAMPNLPEPVKRRIKALKQLQLVTVNIEAKFYEEVHALECKYNKMCADVYEKRALVVSGAYEPSDDECGSESDEEESELTNELKDKVKIEEIKEKNDEPGKEDVKGIPDFWLTIFKNVSLLADMVQEHDEPILKHLIDIKVAFLEADPMGFILEFYFEPNEYFSDTVLTKEYIMKCVPEKNDPFSFEGPEIYKSKGCTINWVKGKNVTLKTIKKSQKHKSRGVLRTVTKTVQNDSFFNFFSPPVVPDDHEVDLDDDMKSLLTSDFEIGHYIRERIVPRAVLYYTGEGLEDEGDDYEEEDGEDDDEDDEDEEDEEDEDDDQPQNKNNKRPTKPPSSNPAECQQQ